MLDFIETMKIGENAGKVWRALSEVREIPLHELSRKIGISSEEVALAVGWLARENNIYIQKREGQLVLMNISTFTFTFG